MPTLTIRNLDEKVKRKLQIRAATNGRSMEAEVRELLAEVVSQSPTTQSAEEDLGSAIHRRFAALGNFDLEIPARSFSTRPIPAFDE